MECEMVEPYRPFLINYLNEFWNLKFSSCVTKCIHEFAHRSLSLTRARIWLGQPINLNSLYWDPCTLLLRNTSETAHLNRWIKTVSNKSNRLRMKGSKRQPSVDFLSLLFFFYWGFPLFITGLPVAIQSFLQWEIAILAQCCLYKLRLNDDAAAVWLARLEHRHNNLTEVSRLHSP